MLATTCKWLYKWKYASLRDLAVPDPGDVSFSWKQLYSSAFDTMKTLDGRHFDQHVDGASGAILEANGGVNGGYDGGDDYLDAGLENVGVGFDFGGEEGGDPMELQWGQEEGEVEGEANQVMEVGEVDEEHLDDEIDVYEQVGLEDPNIALRYITSIRLNECLGLASLAEFKELVTVQVNQTGLVPHPFTISLAKSIELLNRYDFVFFWCSTRFTL
ncbi:uncharacterized protein LOC110714130 [Chenopodium quinoa]|uniref:uncharacterized protein LOC110714130 n=1 Tax=Chenopodium quinoa TaxID=63459 RepID=UPI000B7791E0|nr:uncharacterized protein LOC110714130 [Chenopodium quinoa]